MDIEQRIANFKNMTDADPENELGHFSLGKAYLDAQRDEEALTAFRRVVELKPSFSKAYQHLGEALARLDRKAEAIETLSTGYRIAAERGDVMPRDAMGRLLADLGQQPPEVQTAAAPAPAAAGQETVACCRCGRSANKLPAPPFKGELGKTVHANVCQPCWQDWLAMGTKVINELRLDFSNPAASEAYDAHMVEFLQLPSG